MILIAVVLLSFAAGYLCRDLEGPL